MQNFIKKPSIDLYPGIRVTKDTALEYETDNVHQTIKDLVLHSVVNVEGDGFNSVHDVTIQLQEGDIIIFEAEGRGYIKPAEPLVEVAEAIEELTIIKDMG